MERHDLEVIYEELISYWQNEKAISNKQRLLCRQLSSLVFQDLPVSRSQVQNSPEAYKTDLLNQLSKLVVQNPEGKATIQEKLKELREP